MIDGKQDKVLITETDYAINEEENFVIYQQQEGEQHNFK